MMPQARIHARGNENGHGVHEKHLCTTKQHRETKSALEYRRSKQLAFVNGCESSDPRVVLIGEDVRQTNRIWRKYHAQDTSFSRKKQVTIL